MNYLQHAVHIHLHYFPYQVYMDSGCRTGHF